jgi:chemotaxis protein histidine kinase CheA
MFCHKCGTKNREEATFCKKCGANLVNPTSTNEKVAPTTIVPLSAQPNKVSEQYPVKGTDTNKIRFQQYNPKILAVGVSVVLLILVIIFTVPEVKAFYGYYSGNKKAAQLFLKGDYSDAVKQVKLVNQKGLPKSYKNKLNSEITKYSQVATDDQSFATAKQDEQNGDLTDAKTLLTKISVDNIYPKNIDVIKELSTVNDKITSSAQAAAAASAAQAAAAQKQAEQVAAQERSEEVSKEKAQADAQQAAANAAANQAAAQAEQAAAEQQQAAATEAQEQAAQAAQAAQQELQQAQAQETSAYTNALASGITLLTTAEEDFNYSGDAVTSDDYSLALEDLTTAQNDTYDATHDLPSTYPSNFTSVNNDFINAADYMNLADREESTAIENLDSSAISTAYSNEGLGEECLGEMSTALTALGY